MNRLNIKSIFAAVAIASVTFTSCDGYLETFPSDSLVSTDAITTYKMWKQHLTEHTTV